jgi:3-oxoacyl-[acyl-carrier protein] reductase
MNMKNYIVTASTKGIGLEVVKSLIFNHANEEISVYMSFVHDKEQSNLIYDELSHYKNCLIDLKQIDLSDFREALSYCEYIKEKCSSIDVLILIGGITDRTSFENLTIESYEKVMRTNVTIPFFMIQSLLGLLKSGGEGGDIIMTGSILGIHPHSTSILYGISKASVHALVKNLVKVLAPYGIRINAVAPGFTKTSWHKNKSHELIDRIAGKISLHQFGNSSDIAKAYMFLIENKYMNGHILVIDGGYNYE